MFEKYCSEYFLREVLIKKEDFAPFPKRSDRMVWDNIDAEACKYYIEKAEQIAASPVPQLLASEYMEYSENGNRTHFEDKFHARRSNLRDLVIAECCENRGRFLKTILDYTYSICDEFSWVVPAHNNQKIYNGKWECLPASVEFKLVDLFAAETASVLTWVYYFFEESFEKISRYINERIRFEIRRRILKPFLAGEPMPWMGYERHIVNNWVPWIISNCIPAAEIFAEDYDKICLMQRFMTVLDRFIAEYKPDGGCDEGPGYWNAAGASLFDALEALYDASNGKINLYSDELVKNIGEYIMHAHMFDDIFINFADGSPVPSVSAGVIYRYGKCIGSSALMAFGASLFESVKQPDGNSYFPYRTIKNVLEFKEIKNAEKENAVERQTYLEYLEVCASRDTESGIFAACKGGHNAESHNHNDVGTFMVYKNKRPVVIDPGCETYTAKTFSAERYSIWTMQSQYHNLPVIGGYMQEHGRNYKAENVRCEFRDDGFNFSLNLEKAYPAEAGVKSFQREVSAEYGREGILEVMDHVFLEEAGEIRFYLTFADRPEISDEILNEDKQEMSQIASTDRQERLKGTVKVNDAELVFDAENYSLELETLVLEDEKISADWQGRKELYRAVFTPKGITGEYTFFMKII